MPQIENEKPTLFTSENDPFENPVRSAYYPFIPPGVFELLSAFLFFIGRVAVGKS